MDEQQTADFNEFSDDDEFNQTGGGWATCEDDPFEDDPNDEDPWGDDPDENQWGDELEFDDTALNDEAAEIENAFYKAYYEKDDKHAALESFATVIQLIDDGGDDMDHFKFKSLTEITILYFNQNDIQQTTNYFKQFLICSKTVQPSDLTANLRKILNAVKADYAIYGELHDLTMLHFNPSNQDSMALMHLWLDLGIERCHDLMMNKSLRACDTLINELHGALQSDGNDDMTQTAKLLQVYAVKIQLTMQLIDDLAPNSDLPDTHLDELNALQFKLKDLIEITQRVMTNVDIVDNKAMSIIYECWAKVYAANNDWSTAYKYFKEAFLLYQQIAHNHTTKCLKYLLISYMMLSSFNRNDGEDMQTPNPFDMDEISVYRDHAEMTTMSGLVWAFDQNDIDHFNLLLKRQENEASDTFIERYLSQVLVRLQGQTLCRLVSSYDRVKIQWLANKLSMKLEDVEKLVVNVIIDNELNGRLDQVNGILILKEKEMNINDVTLNAVSKWMESVNALRSTLSSRSCDKSAMYSGFGGHRGMNIGFDTDYNIDDMLTFNQSFLSWDD